MKIKELFEAPIATFKTIGDFEKPGSMPEPDRKLLTSTKAIKKIFDIFSKTPFDFNIYFINKLGSSQGGVSTNIEITGTKFGEIDLEKLKSKNIDLYNEISKTKNNAITIV